MAFTSADAADTQGLLRAGYGSLPEACILLLRVADPAAARAWLAAAPVTSMADLDVPQTRALNLALTREGLAALGIAEPILAGFSAPFLSGIAGDGGRSRRLGDVGANAPEHWDWGAGERKPDMVLLAYATAGDLEAWCAELTAPPFTTAFTVLERLPTAMLDQREPFGFVDGISQPTLDWHGTPDPSEAAHVGYSNRVALGEMLLGYPNEYGLYTERPLLLPEQDPQHLLPPAADRPELRDLGRNGSYLVLRQLQQNVDGFWRCVHDRAGGDTAAGIALAEHMVGRHLSGAPLLPARATVPGVAADERAQNGFTYDGDPDGLTCPFGAHLRRANPRNGDMPAGTNGALARLLRNLGLVRQELRDDLIAATRFHRVLRRGRDYGAQVTPEQALAAEAPVQAGLHFICLNANIARQFEFVQGAWLAGRAFNGLTDQRDPITAPRDGSTDGFSLPQPDAVPRRVEHLAQFVTTRGGAYCFLPSLAALRWLAR
jgi:deferrochelatase/peroxidase EfeB